MISLAGQTALVTGASSGIGAAIAKALAAAGARVVVNYAHSQKGRAWWSRKSLPKGGRLYAFERT